MEIGKCTPAGGMAGIGGGSAHHWTGDGPGRVRNPLSETITIGLGLNIGDTLSTLDAILRKLVEIEAQAEKTARALARLKA